MKEQEVSKRLGNGNGIRMVRELVALDSMFFVAKPPGPLTIHIAAFTGLYTIVGCLGETAMCSR